MVQAFLVPALALLVLVFVFLDLVSALVLAFLEVVASISGHLSPLWRDSFLGLRRSVSIYIS